MASEREKALKRDEEAKERNKKKKEDEKKEMDAGSVNILRMVGENPTNFLTNFARKKVKEATDK
jgi:hypothetical protein